MYRVGRLVLDQRFLVDVLDSVAGLGDLRLHSLG